MVMEVDHDKQVVYTETLALALHEPDLLLAAMQPSEEHVAGRLTSPIVSTHLDTRNIAFERCVLQGRQGWRAAGHKADATLCLRTQEQVGDLGMALREDGGGQRLRGQGAAGSVGMTPSHPHPNPTPMPTFSLSSSPSQSHSHLCPPPSSSLSQLIPSHSLPNPISSPSCLHPSQPPSIFHPRPTAIPSSSHPLRRPPRPVLQVYSASNVELVTKTRTEHLSDQDKSRTKGVPALPTRGRYRGGVVAPCPPTSPVSPQALAPPSTPSWAWHSSTAPTMG